MMTKFDAGEGKGREGREGKGIRVVEECRNVEKSIDGAMLSTGKSTINHNDGFKLLIQDYFMNM